jgi:hypothetical protein
MGYFCALYFPVICERSEAIQAVAWAWIASLRSQ